MGEAPMMAPNRILCRAFVALLLTGCSKSVGAHEPSCLDINNPSVRLEGTLGFEMHFGPPNYGEDTLTDVRYQIRVLRLDRPTAVCAIEANAPAGATSTPTDTSALVSAVQLQITYDSLTAADTSRRIVAFGSLHRPEIGPEYLPIIMPVDSFTLGPKR